MGSDDLLRALYGDEDDDAGAEDLESSDDGESEPEEIDLDDDFDDDDLDLGGLLSSMLGGGFDLDLDEEDEGGEDEDEDEGGDDHEDDDHFTPSDDFDIDDDLDDEDEDDDEDDVEDFEVGGPVEVSCPHCGESMEVFVDPAGGAYQEYVEDCTICCRPSAVRVTVDKAGVSMVDLDPID